VANQVPAQFGLGPHVLGVCPCDPFVADRGADLAGVSGAAQLAGHRARYLRHLGVVLGDDAGVLGEFAGA